MIVSIMEEELQLMAYLAEKINSEHYRPFIASKTIAERAVVRV